MEKGLMMSRRAAYQGWDGHLHCTSPVALGLLPARAPWSETGISWEIEEVGKQHPSEAEHGKRITNRRA